MKKDLKSSWYVALSKSKLIFFLANYVSFKTGLLLFKTEAKEEEEEEEKTWGRERKSWNAKLNYRVWNADEDQKLLYLSARLFQWQTVIYLFSNLSCRRERERESRFSIPLSFPLILKKEKKISIELAILKPRQCFFFALSYDPVTNRGKFSPSFLC